MRVDLRLVIEGIQVLRSADGENVEYDRALKELFDYIVGEGSPIANPMDNPAN